VRNERTITSTGSRCGTFFPFFQTRLTRKKKNRTEAPLVEDIPDTLTLVFYKIMRKLGRFFLVAKTFLLWFSNFSLTISLFCFSNEKLSEILFVFAERN